MIYYIADEHMRVKIGYTRKQLTRRLNLFQVGNADKLKIIARHEGNRKDETDLHHQFATYHISGEWYRIADELLYHIQAIPNNSFLLLFKNEEAKEILPVLENGQNIITNAQEAAEHTLSDAQRVIAEAEKEAEQILDRSRRVIAAKWKATCILGEARKEAEEKTKRMLNEARLKGARMEWKANHLLCIAERKAESILSNV